MYNHLVCPLAAFKSLGVLVLTQKDEAGIDRINIGMYLAALHLSPFYEP